MHSTTCNVPDKITVVPSTRRPLSSGTGHARARPNLVTVLGVTNYRPPACLCWGMLIFIFAFTISIPLYMYMDLDYYFAFMLLSFELFIFLVYFFVSLRSRLPFLCAKNYTYMCAYSNISTCMYFYLYSLHLSICIHIFYSGILCS